NSRNRLLSPRLLVPDGPFTILASAIIAGEGARRMQLSVRDVMRVFNVPEKTIFRWLNHDAMPACCVNGQFRFNRAELLEWATAHQIPVSGDLVDASDDAPPAPELADALEAGGVFYRLPGEDRESA